METLDIEKFDPKVVELQEIAATAHSVMEQYKAGTVGIDEITETRKKLKAVRVRITHTGKALREDAIKFQKDVIAKEKELVAIIEPEEDALSEIEKQIEREKEIAKMKLLLPVRRARIEQIKYTLSEISDDKLNAMDIPEFEAFLVNLQAEMNQVASKKLAEDQAKVASDQKKLDDERAIRDREEKARQEERDRLQREHDQREREAKEKKEREEREAKERLEKEAKEKSEREAEALYKAWYDAITSTDPQATYHTAHAADGSIVLWKRVGTYKPQK